MLSPFSVGEADKFWHDVLTVCIGTLADSTVPGACPALLSVCHVYLDSILLILGVVILRCCVPSFCCVVLFRRYLASFRRVAQLCHLVLSFLRVFLLRRSPALFFNRLERLDCVGSVAPGNVGIRW
jgi:hypothetical protein